MWLSVFQTTLRLAVVLLIAPHNVRRSSSSSFQYGSVSDPLCMPLTCKHGGRGGGRATLKISAFFFGEPHQRRAGCKQRQRSFDHPGHSDH